MFILKIAEALVLNQESYHDRTENPGDQKRSISSLVTPATKARSDKPVKTTIWKPSPDGPFEAKDGERVSRIRPPCPADASSSNSSPSSAPVTMTTPHSSVSPGSADGFSVLPRISPPTLGVPETTRQTSRKSGGTSIYSLPRFSEPLPPVLPHQGLLYSLLVGDDDGKESQCQSPRQRVSSLLVAGDSPSLGEVVNGGKGCSSDRPLGETSCPKRTVDSDISTTPSSRRDAILCSTPGARGKAAQHTNRHRNIPQAFGKLPHVRTNKRLQTTSCGLSTDFYSILKTRLLRRRQSETVRNGGEVDSSESLAEEHGRHFSRSRHHSNLSLRLDEAIGRFSSAQLSPGPTNVSAPARLKQTSQPFPIVSSYCALPSVSSCSQDSDLGERLAQFPMPVTPVGETGTESRGSGTPEARTPESPTEFVQLAKKTARPVQARVTDWLRQVAEFVAVSAPLVSTMKTSLECREVTLQGGHEKQQQPEEHSSSDTSNRQMIFGTPLAGILQPTAVAMDMWLALLIKCWHRLLALYMAENGLDLVVVDHRWVCEPIGAGGDKMATEVATGESPPDLNLLSLPWSLLPDVQNSGITAVQTLSRRPDRKFADSFAEFLVTMKQVGLTAQEFFLLRNVILMTAHEPEAIASVGLNVICVSRSQRARHSTESINKAMATRDASQLPLSSEAASCPPGQNTSSKEVNELAHLSEGLTLLSSLCPYRMTNLFCTHLYNGSSPLNSQFLLNLHSRFLMACQETLKSSMQTS